MEEVEDLAGASAVAFLEGAGPILCSSSFVPCGDHWKGCEGLHQCHFFLQAARARSDSFIVWLGLGFCLDRMNSSIVI